jgi:RNA polymerase sigma factor (sigma-70 family)
MVLGPDFLRVLIAAKGGAEWAWASLYRDLAGAVRGYFRARGATDPEDLASETFFQIARDIQSFDGDETGFRSWVFVIAHRRLMDSWRMAAKQPRRATFEEAMPDVHGGNTEDEALERMATAEVLSALGRLTEDQGAVLALRIIGGLSAEQTAEVLGRRAGAVRALQHRGLLALQEIIEKTE